MRTETYVNNGIIFTETFAEEIDLSTPEENEIKLNICSTCEYNNGDNCGSCGCLLEQLMFYKESKCPENKW